VKRAVVAPVATVTLAGTVAAAVLLLESATFLCAALPAAGAFNVTVPVAFAAPPTMLVGFTVRELTINGVTFRVASADLFKVAVTMGLATELTTRDVTVKLAMLAPLATVTIAGTVAAAVLLLDRVTVLWAALPAAGAFSVTVPMALAVPPITLSGFRDNDNTPGCGSTYNTAFWLTPFSVAEISAVLAAPTAWLVTVKFADIAPEGTMTATGTVAAAVLSLASNTTLCQIVPTAGAFNVTIPVELLIPPSTLDGFRVTSATDGRVTISEKC
jgi:hypothetical protein